MDPESVTVQDVDGQRLEAEIVDQRADGSLALRAPDGRRVVVPAKAIAQRHGDDLHIAGRIDDIVGPSPSDAESPDTITVPIVEEHVVIDKRSRPGATVSVTTRTTEREEAIDEIVKHETVHVERVPVERFVDAPAPVREEGNTTIVPLHEEVLVIEKRLLLKEELHVTRREEDRRETHQVTLRSQRADIERSEPDEA